MKDGYVVNLHLLENCNYKCKHCFSHFDSVAPLPVCDWKRIVDNITEKTSVCRFNLAGGETLLYKGLDDLISYINSKDIDVSLITNGHLLSEKRIGKLKGKVSMIGISIDALDPYLLKKIGRCTKTQEILDMDRCVSLCKSIKENDMQLKLNTVVTKLNINENFSHFMKIVSPDRWKILKMKRFSHNNFDNSYLEITENEFNLFCSRHNFIPYVKETSLKNAYIIIDPRGFLLDNSDEKYNPVADLLQEDFSTGFNNMYLNTALYESRYKMKTA